LDGSSHQINRTGSPAKPPPDIAGGQRTQR